MQGHPWSLPELTGLELEGLPSGERLSEMLALLPSLECLALHGRTGPLTRVPSVIRSLTGLKKLDLSGWSSLAELPDAASCLTLLETLSLSGCAALEVIPEWIGELALLVTWEMTNCSGLTTLPDGVSRLARLFSL